MILHWPRSVAAWLSAITLVAGLVGARAQDAKDPKPELSLRANPALALAPARIAFTAELRGGHDDFEDFYCPRVEWEWGDGTRSARRADCDPYVEGKSRIRRFYRDEHIFRAPGRYDVWFRLKQGSRTVGATRLRFVARAPAPSNDLMSFGPVRPAH